MRKMLYEIFNSRPPNTSSQEMENKRHQRWGLGDHESLGDFKGEGALEMYTQCEKHDKHRSFVPMELFTISDLPPEYQNPLVYEMIQVQAALTVRVSVEWTSPNRPRSTLNDATIYPVYPGGISGERNAGQYPFSDKRGTNDLRVGSGIVWHVVMHEEEDGATCPCGACVNSPTPSKEWAELIVYTAVHLIFDEAEAQKASCRLHYDKVSSGNGDLTLLEGVGIKTQSRNTDERRPIPCVTPSVELVDCDTCCLICVTHDTALAEKLRGLEFKYYDLVGKVNDEYSGKEHRLVVIVSHPHGCPKYVSVGEWTEQEELDFGETAFAYQYQAPTCPGSSGAFVYTMGHIWTDPHVHSCSNKENCGYSSTAVIF
ncbi:unnamed protein product [Lymnaea stagnalis]|uniref:Uncharacterized protein n=1 Tax=Lymnaea stagnalis TaxID=6523 RepID=A0AAV2HJ93_LYMST